MGPTRSLRIYRVQDGIRVPYTIEIDSELTVINEYADTTHLDHVRRGRSNHPTTELTPERRKSIAVSRWVSKSVADNPIPGTEDLREEYFEEHRRLIDKHTERGSKCPACEVGKLIRRYREKLEKAGHLENL